MAGRVADAEPVRAEAGPRGRWWGTGAAALVLATLGTAAAVWRLGSWRATTWDLGLYTQYLWLLSHGDGLARSTLDGIPAAADAGAWVLYPLAWLYRGAGPAGILAAQALALASGVVGLRWWADRLRLPPAVFWGVAVLWAAYPAVLGPLLFDWHPDVVAVPLLFWAMAAVATDRPGHFWTAAGLLLLTKITMSLVVVGLAVPWWLRRRFGLGLACVGVGLGAGLVELNGVLPGLLHHAYPLWPPLYGWLGPTPGAAVLRIVAEPGWVWAHMRQGAVIRALVLLLVPVGIVPAVTGLWRGGWTWPAWLVVAFNSLSHFGPQLNPYTQYWVAVAPGFFVAALDLAARMRLDRARTVLPWLLAGWATLMWWRLERPLVWYTAPPAAALTAAAHRIPPAAPLVGQNATLAPLAGRPRIALLPLPPDDQVRSGTYVLLTTDVNPVNRITPPALVERTIRRLAASPAWYVVYHAGSVWLFVRR
ncbi:MAG: DUF2079 domain-containing protein [Actinomycetia bacterium]|nr:DUF2079 domain-containing protein [Actinomycetes bacterium]